MNISSFRLVFVVLVIYAIEIIVPILRGAQINVIGDAFVKLIALLLLSYVGYDLIFKDRRMSSGFAFALTILAVALQISSNDLAHPHYTIPLSKFTGTIALVLFSSIVAQIRNIPSRNVALLIYQLCLMVFIDLWRVENEFIWGEYQNYYYSISYLWVCIILPSTLFKKMHLGYTKTKFSSSSLLVLLGGILFYGLFTTIMSHFFKANVSPMFGNPAVQNSSHDVLRLALAHFMYLTGVCLFIAAPEELFFREMLPNIMKSAFNITVPCRLILSSLLFALIHVHTDNHIYRKLVLSFTSGIIFFVAKTMSKNINVSILLHTITYELFWIEF